MNHPCSACRTTFPVTRSARSRLAWGVGLHGIYTTDIGRALDEFTLVACPECGNVESEPRLRILGLFTPLQFKVVIVLACLFAIATAVVSSFG